MQLPLSIALVKNLTYFIHALARTLHTDIMNLGILFITAISGHHTDLLH